MKFRNLQKVAFESLILSWARLSLAGRSSIEKLAGEVLEFTVGWEVVYFLAARVETSLSAQ